jgi:hypothetical protein
MARLYCIFVVIFFVAAGAVAQEEAVIQGEAGVQEEAGIQEEAGVQSEGNTWFNLGPVENRWNIGFYGGYTNNNLYQGGAEHSRPGKIWENGHGWTAGILARYQIFNWLAAQTEAVFITKNYGYRYSAYGNELSNNTVNSFVEIPLFLNVSIRPAGGGWVTGLRLYANVGGSLGVWAASRETGRNLSVVSYNPVYKYDEDYEFDDRRDNRFEYGLAAGLGVQYEKDWAGVFVECRYNYGLSDLQQTYQYELVPQMNSTWTLLLGFLVNPGKIGTKR